MRVLLLLRGAPGVGKSTWIEQNGLKNYAVSADEIRMLYAAPMLNVNGSVNISMSHDQEVWKTLFKILEYRMQNGEFTVVDATNSKTSEMNRYKELCSAYKYRMYCVDFTDVPVDVVKERNASRSEYKRVPNEVIDKMYSRFETQKIPAGITVIKPDELDKVWIHPIDLSEYRRVHIIGDVHGCYTALMEYLSNNGGIKDDECYIFTGDYLDRGIENVEVVKLMLDIYERRNIIMLEGNHERWMWVWANNGVAKSREFELVTKTQLENAEISKRDVRKLYRRIAQCAYFNYHGKTFLVNHAGISTLPENLTLISTSALTKGVGSYNEFEEVADSFVKNTPDNYYQVHGHRNTKGSPVQVNSRVFNLEGRVEFGGCLRCLQITHDGELKTFEIPNAVFQKPEEFERKYSGTERTVGDVIMSLRESRYVQEKQFGDISSFSFTKDAFYKKVWDEQTIKARGLYINIPKQKVVARAYDKFFNVNECPETKLDSLQNRMQFPATAYVKENGFLGIVSYNPDNDELFITTKSNPDGDYARWLREELFDLVPSDGIQKMKDYAKAYNVSFVFECIDTKRDPHIIEYDRDQLFLLDVVYNDINYRKLPFDQLCEVSEQIGIPHKEKAKVFESWSEFYDWYYEVIAEDYKYRGKNIEGFVVEDSTGFMFKLKLAYYNFWKFMRGIAHETIRRGYIDGKKTSSLATPLANHFYAWAKTLHESEHLDSVPRDIITLRNLFYKENKFGETE